MWGRSESAGALVPALFAVNVRPFQAVSSPIRRLEFRLCEPAVALETLHLGGGIQSVRAVPRVPAKIRQSLPLRVLSRFTAIDSEDAIAVKWLASQR